MWSCQCCALSERCQFYQIERLPTPLKNCAIATLQPHNKTFQDFPGNEIYIFLHQNPKSYLFRYQVLTIIIIF